VEAGLEPAVPGHPDRPDPPTRRKAQPEPKWKSRADRPSRHAHTRGQDQNAEPDKIKRCAVHPGSGEAVGGWFPVCQCAGFTGTQASYGRSNHGAAPLKNQGPVCHRETLSSDTSRVLLRFMISRVISQFRDRLRIARDPIGYARGEGVKVGDDCRLLGVKRGQFGSEPYLICIGNHVTITDGVRFITHDGGVWVLRERFPDIDVIGRITIHNNVFIGTGAILLPNIEIGPNSVVAAGAVVSHDVLAGTVVGGVPAKVIRTVDDYEAGVLPRAIHVRSMPTQAKREVFLHHTAR
jgi:acetyltransferase-like isoleucine patch superfamily enzyme